MVASLPESWLINADPRPTFVLNNVFENQQHQVTICFRNDAFQRFASTRRSTDDLESKCTGRYASYHWIRYTSGPYVVVSGTVCCTETVDKCVTEDLITDVSLKDIDTSQQTTNFKALRRCIGSYVTPSMNSLLELMEGRAWPGIGVWPTELLELMRLVLIMGHEKAMALALGDKQLLFYNELYSLVSGPRHPHNLALPIDEAFPERLPMKAESDAALNCKGFDILDMPFPFQTGLKRHDVVEERYATWTTVKISTPPNSMLIMANDCTDSVLNSREGEALATLRRNCTNLNDFPSFCEAAKSISIEHPKDVSFMLFYSYQEGSVLETAFPTDTIITSPSIRKILQDATQSDDALILTLESLPVEWQNMACTNGFGDRAKSAVVTALRSSPELTDVYGLLVLGLNPRRFMDTKHENFAKSLVIELSACALSSYRRAREAEEKRSNIERIQSFSSLIEMTEVGLFEFRSDNGKLVRANDAYYKLSGYPRISEAEQTEWMFQNLLVPEDIDTALGFWKQVIDDQKPVTGEFRFKYQHEDLTDEDRELGGRWVIASCLPLLNEQGKTTILTGCVLDGTAQKRANLHLIKRAQALELAKKTEERFSTFALSAPAGIYIFSPERKLLYRNSKFLEIMGAPEDTDAASFDYAQYVFEEELEMVTDAFETVFSEGKSHVHEFRVKRLWRSPQGEESPAWVRSVPFVQLDENGKVKSAQGLLFDISSLKWAEAQERHSKESALEAKQRHEAFVDTTSHELRNPLTAVIQCTDIVLESLQQIGAHARNMVNGAPEDIDLIATELRQEVQSSTDSMKIIAACSGHQLRLISDILTLSKLDSQLLEIVPGPVRFVDTMRMCTEMFRPMAEAKDVKLNLELDDSLAKLGVDWVSIDNNRVISMTSNLLTNGIKFSDTEGLRKITVKLGASATPMIEVFEKVVFHSKPLDPSLISPENIWLFCSVTDSGIGLSESQQDHLFRRFSQTHAPKTHSKYGGSGLGLYISRSLAELQGGEISVFSAGEGTGSTFAFYIRSAKIPAPSDQICNPNSDNMNAMRKLSLTHDSVLSCLVVEDNVINNKVLTQQLKKHNFEVHTAFHGGEALDFIKTTRHWKGNYDGPAINVILMDAEMPILNGPDCARAIRQLEMDGQITSHIPIIAVSANARKEQIKDMMDAGMDDSISKPFKIADLVPKIQRLV